MIELSPDQAAAIEAASRWWENERDTRPFRLGGGAGSGKTTIARTVIERLDLKPFNWADALSSRTEDGVILPQPDTFIAAAPTRRAASQLLRKGVPARTIHGVAYSPLLKATGRSEERLREILEKQQEIEAQIVAAIDAGQDQEAEKLGHALRALQDEEEKLEDPDWSFFGDMIAAASLLFVDEASMVSKETCLDLESVGTPVLYVGDPYQLPPIAKGESRPKEHFTLPLIDVVLTQTHRQAAGNGVLDLATALRSGEPLRHVETQDVQVRPTTALLEDMRAEPQAFLERDLFFITDTNERRAMFNRSMRKMMGREDWHLAPGDRLMVRKNAPKEMLSNGDVIELIEVVWSDLANAYVCRRYLHLETGEEREIPLAFVAKALCRTYDLFHYPKVNVDGCRSEGASPVVVDYGFAITCHASQGSERARVIVAGKWLGGQHHDIKMRWVYTALTRARVAARMYLPEMEGVAAWRGGDEW